VNQNSVLPATLIINLLKDGSPWSCLARSPNPEQNC
jgi:hypothetical protein